MAKTFKKKRAGFGVEMRTFQGQEGVYLVLRVGGSYHVFAEIEAKDAARDCDPTVKESNVRNMWNQIWRKP